MCGRLLPCPERLPRAFLGGLARLWVFDNDLEALLVGLECALTGLSGKNSSTRLRKLSISRTSGVSKNQPSMPVSLMKLSRESPDALFSWPIFPNHGKVLHELISWMEVPYHELSLTYCLLSMLVEVTMMRMTAMVASSWMALRKRSVPEHHPHLKCKSAALSNIHRKHHSG